VLRIDRHAHRPTQLPERGFCLAGGTIRVCVYILAKFWDRNAHPRQQPDTEEVGLVTHPLGLFRVDHGKVEFNLGIFVLSFDLTSSRTPPVTRYIF
jgi:hypothetical protein